MFENLRDLFILQRKRPSKHSRAHPHTYTPTPSSDPSDDAEALLSTTSNSSSTTLGPTTSCYNHLDDEKDLSSSAYQQGLHDAHLHGTRIAVRTALLCTAVYLGVGVAMMVAFRGAKVIGDVEGFVMGRVMEYCEYLTS